MRDYQSLQKTVKSTHGRVDTSTPRSCWEIVSTAQCTLIVDVAHQSLSVRGKPLDQGLAQSEIVTGCRHVSVRQEVLLTVQLQHVPPTVRSVAPTNPCVVVFGLVAATVEVCLSGIGS